MLILTWWPYRFLSTQQPLIISAWNDLAGPDCDRLSTWAAKFNIIRFTALKVTSHKGLPLASTMSTTIIHEPNGDRAAALAEWALRHRDTLADRQARVLDVRNTSKERQVMTICALKEKKDVNTLQDERQFLRVVVPEPSFEKLHAYLGCSNCNKRTDVPAGETHTCLNYGQENVISIPR
ncbi:uncharacterized protein LOC125492773 [Beta vulgaris subsp. vulgaris]|uniref:uncharacterized protein LOC125492773 n=1 Tax=Beta vulgaris subsp. vulgaris TaxID=3555 RepID=UPI00254952BE|nr:uncharacterized protein LOC125492773 [Beta vulgaris subsp. vulgaris]